MIVKLDTTAIHHITLFEDITKAKVKDCIEQEEKIIFVVNEGELGLAIGKESKNLKMLKSILNKNIDVIEYSDDAVQFIKNIFHNYKVREVRLSEERTEVVIDPNDKARAIGKNGRNLKVAREIAQRHHGIQNMVIR